MGRSMKETSGKTKRKDMERRITRLTYPNKRVYKGGFKNGKPHGKGVLYQRDGTVIKGIWDMGVIISD